MGYNSTSFYFNPIIVELASCNLFRPLVNLFFAEVMVSFNLSKNVL